ncbi:MAG: SDR family oxidoreductase [bacterium]|nr:SDR family oxidoreductase [bacterium]
MTPPLHEQVVVITGASSGIGRETALKFAQSGAKVVLAARNRTALETVASQIEATGGEATIVTVDVSNWQQVKHLAEQAMNTYGRIDTWVNDAAASVYGTVEETPVEEFDQIIHVNLLGTIYGVKAVLPHMRAQGGGTIINIGSVLSERAVPLQAGYVATKFGVRGFTDALRMELQREKSGIRVTLIMPASINTPFFDHARSNMETEPRPIPPVYHPEIVADAILYASQHYVRQMYAGGAGLMFGLMERLSPALSDRMMQVMNWTFKAQKANQPNDERDSLERPMAGPGRVEGDFGHLTKPSMYTRYRITVPRWAQIALPAVALGAFQMLRRR